MATEKDREHVSKDLSNALSHAARSEPRPVTPHEYSLTLAKQYREQIVRTQMNDRTMPLPLVKASKH